MRSRVGVSIFVVVILAAGSAVASTGPSLGELLTEGAFGLLGGAAGTAFSIAAVGQLTPLVASPLGKTVVVVVTLALGAGTGASAGVLVAGEVLDVNARPLACLSGGLLGGLLAAFAEPILYLLGVPEAVAEFLGFALLPILPAIGATLGLNLALHP